MSDCQEALLLSLDQNYGVIECWSVLYSLAKRLQEWIDIEVPQPTKADTPPETNNSDTNNLTNKDGIDIEDISEFFKKYHKEKQETEMNIEDSDEKGSDLNESNDYKGTIIIIKCHL